MSIRRVTSPHVPEPPPERWSNCLVSDGIAYVSGMTARGTDPAELAKMDEYEQAKLIFNKIKGMVEAAGGAMADVVWHGGAQTFIHKGTNGRWKDVLTTEELAQYEAAMAKTLPPDCARWLENGGAYD